MEWNYADVWEAVADAVPDALAWIHGDRRGSWSEFDAQADAIGERMLSSGVERQDKVALYLYIGPEYLAGVFAAFKAGLVPVNTNYRYGRDELLYLWDNADAVAVVFHGCCVEGIRFGEVVAAAVELQSPECTESELITHVKERLAGYKAPRHVLIVESLGRAENGKADYAGVGSRVRSWLEGRAG